MLCCDGQSRPEDRAQKQLRLGKPVSLDQAAQTQSFHAAKGFVGNSENEAAKRGVDDDVVDLGSKLQGVKSGGDLFVNIRVVDLSEVEAKQKACGR